jgi:ElaB/YqjD/DUF883 family membrane-anchored ribosome-binding protein
MAFIMEEREQPAIEVRVNFGVFAGRDATPAELDRLAEFLLDEIGEVSIISEERHEIDENVEASVHQVVVQVADGGRDPAAVAQTIVERADHWVRICVADRHAEIADA